MALGIGECNEDMEWPDVHDVERLSLNALLILQELDLFPPMSFLEVGETRWPRMKS